MNKNEQINKLIEDVLSSVDSVSRATPAAYLLTRINARLNKANETLWEKAGWFIGRPSFAITGLAMLIIINVVVVAFTKQNGFAAATEQASAADEVSYNTVASIYDIENTEP